MKKVLPKKYDPLRYTLTFQANGVSVFVADIHRDVYKALNVLFIIDRGVFKQYFPTSDYDKALRRGVVFYKNKKKFNDYKRQLKRHFKSFDKFAETNIKGHKNISKRELKNFFVLTTKLCRDYTQMNVESTDLAYMQSLKNPVIRHNLKQAGKFKDQVRNYMNMVLFEPQGYTASVFKILERQFGVPVTVLENLTQKELLQLYSGSKINKTKVLRRQSACIIAATFSIPLEGSSARKIIRTFKHTFSRGNIVTGQSANIGQVIARAKIIPVDYGDFRKVTRAMSEMKKGEVLIAETTAPELMIACKKAAAIITDLGGLMSHAAIVAREFGVPCVVGTKFATKIFKDGDLVEVDAYKGIIKKL